MRIKSEAWEPIGVEALEPAGWAALRHEANAVVVAGPGAGKTEFLAQRACYLLQTGLCPAPKRILAISFKTDAARNLRDRIQARLPPTHGRRLDSMTFDSFTKQLLDRFYPALPPSFRLASGYEVAFVKQRSIDYFLRTLATPSPWVTEVEALPRDGFEPAVVGAYRLPESGIEAADGLTFALREWWGAALGGGGPANLTFTHINRLSELIVRASGQIRRALWATYPYVFIDECQDTTIAQFDFVTSVFGGSPSRITAVGDAKQRIMGWAGAMPDAVAGFTETFGATAFELQMNHRSVPELVRLQHVVARALSPGGADLLPLTPLPPDTQAAQIWRVDTATIEAAVVARSIREMIDGDPDLRPSAFALLVRQTPDSFEGELSEAFAAVGLSLRNESQVIGRTTLQDLLLDDLTLLVTQIMRLATRTRSPQDWITIGQTLREVWGVDPYDEGASRFVDDALSVFVAETTGWLIATDLAEEAGDALLGRILDFVGRPRLEAAVPSYRTGDAFEVAEEAVRLRLRHATHCQTWAEVPDRYVAADAVPLMTVHKSKGLEYQHVFFLGIDDNLWWAHSPGSMEGVATFFVGLSRARLSARFTFCEERGSRTKVADLYDLLAAAGVPEIHVAG